MPTKKKIVPKEPETYVGWYIYGYSEYCKEWNLTSIPAKFTKAGGIHGTLYTSEEAAWKEVISRRNDKHWYDGGYGLNEITYIARFNPVDEYPKTVLSKEEGDEILVYAYGGKSYASK